MKDDSSSHRPELTPEKSSERGASAVPPPPPEAPKQSKTTATASTGIPIQPKPTMGVTQPGMSANMNADTLGRQVLSGGTSTSTTTTGVVSSQNKNKVPEGSGAAKPLPSTNYTNMKLSPDVLNALQLSGLGGLPHQQGAVGNRQAQPSLAPNLQQAAASSQNFGNLLFSLGLIPPQSTTGSSASGGISILSPSFQAGMLGYGSSNNSGRSQQQQMSRLLPNPPRAQVAASSTSSVEQRPMVCAPATATGTSTAPKRVVVPCRARGMPLEHNFQVRSFRSRHRLDDLHHASSTFLLQKPILTLPIFVDTFVLMNCRLHTLKSVTISNMEMVWFVAIQPVEIRVSSFCIVLTAGIQWPRGISRKAIAMIAKKKTLAASLMTTCRKVKPSSTFLKKSVWTRVLSTQL
jgi:hypothetical protein